MDRGDYLELVYIVYNTADRKKETITTKLRPGALSIRTVTGLYMAADWYERELFEMFGVRIDGRKARRLLLEKWNGSGYPLRKSFAWGNPNYKKS